MIMGLVIKSFAVRKYKIICKGYNVNYINQGNESTFTQCVMADSISLFLKKILNLLAAQCFTESMNSKLWRRINSNQNAVACLV